MRSIPEGSRLRFILKSRAKNTTLTHACWCCMGMVAMRIEDQIR
jgi:hypothetical protein